MITELDVSVPWLPTDVAPRDQLVGETYRRVFDVTLASSAVKGVELGLADRFTVHDPLSRHDGWAVRALPYDQCMQPKLAWREIAEASHAHDRDRSIRQRPPAPVRAQRAASGGAGSLRPGLRPAIGPAAAPALGRPCQPSRLLRAVRPMAVPTWQSVLVVITAVMFGTDLAEVLFAPTGEHHSPQLRMLYLLIYAVFGLLLVSSKDAVRTLVTTAPVLVLVLALPVVSILWSRQSRGDYGAQRRAPWHLAVRCVSGLALHPRADHLPTRDRHVDRRLPEHGGDRSGTFDRGRGWWAVGRRVDGNKSAQERVSAGWRRCRVS